MICLSCATIPVKNAEVTHIEPIQYEQRGYLNESFRLFYLADDHAGDIEYHYHTFHKIILLLAGRAGYAVEGEHYDLNPGDFVLVGRGSIHRPVVADGDYYERMIRKLGIRVQLNTECTPQMLRAMDPYAVFVATGSDEFIPPIDGLSGENVLSVREYIRSKPAVSGKRVVVLGAGQTGLEAARMLAQDNAVTVVDMMPDEIPANTDHRLDLFYAKDAGVQTVLGHRILRVDDAGVTVASVASGEERVLPADLVVVALGVRPVAELYNEIKDAFPHVCKLGDSVKPGFIVHATTAAYEAAASLPTKPYEVKEIYFAAEKEAVKPQLINPYA